MVLGGEVVLERNPLLVMQQRRSSPQLFSEDLPFCLPATPGNDSTTESPVLNPTVMTSTPATIPLVQKPRVVESQSQPTNMLQKILREAAVAAMKETAERESTAAAAAASDMEAIDTAAVLQ